MKRLVLLSALSLAACVGDTTCRVEHPWDLVVGVGDDRWVQMQGSSRAWGSYERFFGPDCRQPDCNVIGDSIFFLQRVVNVESVLAKGRGSLSHCDVIVTRSCTYDRDRQAKTLRARGECGLDTNLENYFGD